MKVYLQRERRRLKYAATLNDEALPEGTDPDFELHYIDIGDVDSYGRVHDIARYHFEAAPSRARRKVQHGDVIISTVRTYLQAIAPIENPPDNLIVSTGFAVVRPRTDVLDSGFCKYALREPRFIWEVEGRSTGISYPAINASELGDIRIELPPLQDQCRIADYLDAETAQIDALVAEKERMLTLLEEKRAGLVSGAVTRGLNPDASLKPSGIPWLGSIPRDWKVWRLKHFARLGNGSTPNREKPGYWDGGDYPWLNSSVVNDRQVREPSRYVTERALLECHLPKISPPALLIAITGQGKTRGKSTVLEFEATINQHIAFVKPVPEAADCVYLSYLLDTAYDYLRSESDGAGSTRGAITCEQLGDFHVALPPIEEQRGILHFIEQQTSAHSTLKGALRQSVTLLRERRSALITAAVTGQLDPEAVATGEPAASTSLSVAVSSGSGRP